MVHARKTAIVLASVLLLVSSGVGMSQSFGGGLFEDFNDGNLDDWSYVGPGWETDSTSTWEGDYAMYGQPGLSEARLPVQSDTYNRITYRLKYPSFGGQKVAVTDSSEGKQLIELRVSSSGSGTADLISYQGLDNTVDTGIDLQSDTWYAVSVYNIDYSNNQYDIEVTDKSGNVVGNATGFGFVENGEPDQLRVYKGDNNPFYIDFLTYNGGPVETYELSGTVTDETDNSDINGATVEAYNDSGGLANSDTTNSVGQYSMDLPNGTYLVWVNKTGYQNENRTITVDGQDQVQNFALASFNASIELRTKQYIPHGGTAPYSVIVTVDGDRKDVTDTATVTSGNTSVVTVDSTALEIIATSDITVNQRTTLTATWTDSNGNEYTTTRNVTVANATVKNLQILPTWTRVSASLDDQTLQVIILATMIGAGAAALASSFAGLSASTGIVVLGWFAGYTSDGVLIVSFMFAIFVGLNLANNTTIMSQGTG